MEPATVSNATDPSVLAHAPKSTGMRRHYCAWDKELTAPAIPE